MASFSLWTDRVPSIRQVIEVQRANPISLHPMVYHAITHTAIRIFGAGPFSIRLASLFGFLLMQICRFVFVRRAVSERAGRPHICGRLQGPGLELDRAGVRRGTCGNEAPRNGV